MKSSLVLLMLTGFILIVSIKQCLADDLKVRVKLSLRASTKLGLILQKKSQETEVHTLTLNQNDSLAVFYIKNTEFKTLMKMQFTFNDKTFSPIVVKSIEFLNGNKNTIIDKDNLLSYFWYNPQRTVLKKQNSGMLYLSPKTVGQGINIVMRKFAIEQLSRFFESNGNQELSFKLSIGSSSPVDMWVYYKSQPNGKFESKNGFFVHRTSLKEVSYFKFLAPQNVHTIKINFVGKPETIIHIENLTAFINNTKIYINNDDVYSYFWNSPGLIPNRDSTNLFYYRIASSKGEKTLLLRKSGTRKIEAVHQNAPKVISTFKVNLHSNKDCPIVFQGYNSNETDTKHYFLKRGYTTIEDTLYSDYPIKKIAFTFQSVPDDSITISEIQFLHNNLEKIWDGPSIEKEFKKINLSGNVDRRSSFAITPIEKQKKAFLILNDDIVMWWYKYFILSSILVAIMALFFLNPLLLSRIIVVNK